MYKNIYIRDFVGMVMGFENGRLVGFCFLN